MSNILKVNKGAKVKQYTEASIKRINLSDANSITNNMLQDAIVNDSKLESGISEQVIRSRKNIIINGGCDMWQRSTSTASISTTPTYVADRYKIYTSAGNTYTCSRDTSVPSTENLAYSLKLLSAGTGTTGLSIIRYQVEGYDYLPIANGKNVTLSFWVKASTAGTYCIAFANSAANRSYVAEYIISSGEINTWVKRYIQITTDTVGTWVFDNGAGLEISWMLAQGSNIGVSGWQAGTKLTTSNQVNGMGTAGSTFYLTGVMLYEGWTENSGFYRAGRTIQEELALCQRYYEKSYSLETNPATSTNTSCIQWRDSLSVAGVYSVILNTRYIVEKRSNVPAVVIYDLLGNINKCSMWTADNISVSISSRGTNNFIVQATDASAASRQLAFHYTADAEF